MTAWLRCFAPRPDAAVRLVCFPHAGGSASAYHQWPAALGDGIEMHAVQYPGRADRFPEPLEPDPAAIARAVVAALPADGKDLALFGHSMGALLAYEVARSLPGVRRLVVSGSLPPHTVHDQPPLWDPDDEVLVANLRELGGAGLEALTDPQLRPLVLPYIRNDLRLVDRYRHEPGPPAHFPITVLVGDSDRRAPTSRVGRWAELTEGPCRVRVFPGGHFYLDEQREAVTAAIGRELLDPMPAQ
ncbi:thioesterase II family protein [Actinokineospora pegani]|uniref:thioesterase II family protein n=1 Tax=Actinokineospora pegani TaxID=2654637 RepID=UPI0012EA49FD|nr:alpha/beta fold hydrolase [Actinokineospora pegani]